MAAGAQDDGSAPAALYVVELDRDPARCLWDGWAPDHRVGHRRDPLVRERTPQRYVRVAMTRRRTGLLMVMRVMRAWCAASHHGSISA